MVGPAAAGVGAGGCSRRDLYCRHEREPGRSGGGAPAPVVAQAPSAESTPVAETPAADDITVTRAEFARLEQRLRAIEHADVQLASRTGGGVDQDELFARVSALEQRGVENDRRTLGLISTVATLAREAENQRGRPGPSMR